MPEQQQELSQASLLDSPSAYIGRDEQKALLLRETDYLVHGVDVGCRVLFFQAEGGVGKTRLLQQYPMIVQKTSPEVRIAHPIDLYRFEVRSPNVIEQELINGLKQHAVHAPEWYRLRSAEVDTLFEEYYRASNIYMYSPDAAYASEQLRMAFVTCWNNLTASYPLVISFDTIETLFNSPAPVEAVIMTEGGDAGETLFLDWISTVLPQLRRTLVLCSSRPLNPRQYPTHPLVDRLEQRNLLVAPVQELKPFTEAQDIETYLKEYDVAVAAEEISYIKDITQGRPLLLTCYAEVKRPDSMIPLIKNPENVTDREGFEEYILDYILHPFQHTEPHVRTFLYCLFFLAIARRGLRRMDLRMLFQQQQYTQVVDAVIDQLNTALVKTLPATWVDDTGISNQVSTDILFLHDEIYQMIDDSGLVGALGLDSATDSVLQYLVDMSKQQVEQAKKHQQQWMGSAELLRAMSDHVYYAVTLNIVQGYRIYTIYVDQLLDQHNIDAALVVSDTFWRTLGWSVNEQGEVVQPVRLKESQSLTYTQIIHDEQVRQVRLLHAQARAQEALDRATQLYEKFKQEGWLERDLYLRIDLSLLLAHVIMLARSSGYHESAVQHFSDVITLLADANASLLDADEFLRLRRRYFLGVAYTLRGYLHREEQDFVKAQADAEAARAAFKAYNDNEAQVLNEDVRSALAQVTNNLAYSFSLSGELRRALRFSEEILERYIDACSLYQRALFYNTNALILINMGRYLEAEEPLNQAMQAADKCGIKRAKGLVMHARGRLERETHNARRAGESRPEIGEYYAKAKDYLEGEPDSLREVYFEWSSFVRELAVFYKNQQRDFKMAEDYKLMALDLLDKSLEQLHGDAPTQRADCLKSKAIIHNLMEEYDMAAALLDEVEALLRNNPMPAFGQVISGKVALQRSVIQLRSQGNYQEALRLMTIALARVYLFAGRHRDQGDFEQQIERFVQEIPHDELQAFKELLDSEQVIVALDDAELSYQPPNAEKWETVWRGSVRFVSDTIANQLAI